MKSGGGEWSITRSFKMKGIFWNCNGFRDPRKFKFISDETREHNLSFIAISETCHDDFLDPFLKNLCAGCDFL